MRRRMRQRIRRTGRDSCDASRSAGGCSVTAPETVANVKIPKFFHRSVPTWVFRFPNRRCRRRQAPANWLVKRRGGAGGAHIKPALQAHGVGGEIYYQRKVSGTPVSALFSPTENAPWCSDLARNGHCQRRASIRYGGAVRPAMMAPGSPMRSSAAVDRLAACDVAGRTKQRRFPCRR